MTNEERVIAFINENTTPPYNGCQSPDIVRETTMTAGEVVMAVKSLRKQGKLVIEEMPHYRSKTGYLCPCLKLVEES